MNERIFLLIAGIIAGFSLIKLPLSGTFLASLQPAFDIVGIVSVTVFSLVLAYKGFMNTLGKS